MLEELAKILFPDEEIEIYVIPAQDGCHQDNFWIKIGKITNNATFATISGVLLAAFLASSLTRSQIELNQSQEELINLQIQQAKLELKKQNIDVLPSDTQLKQVVTSQNIKKAKSQYFSQLQKDTDIIKDQIIAKQE